MLSILNNVRNFALLDTQKTTEVYINLNAKMLPFKGLLNFLEAGFDLFFFSKNKSLLELRFSFFKKFLEESLGLKKAQKAWCHSFIV